MQEVFDLSSINVPHCSDPVYVRGRAYPCGHCPLCLRKAKIDWINRCQCEQRSHKFNCSYITLTFENDVILDNGKLDISDYGYKQLQNFMKRLRKFLGSQKIKYFGSFERGDQFGRPHYHLIIFGYYPKNLNPLKYKNVNEWFSARFWKNGFVKIEPVNYNSISYVCGYVMKKFDYGKNSDDEYFYNRKLKLLNKYTANDQQLMLLSDFQRLEKSPFYFMSRGIGFDYLVENLDRILKYKNLSFGGKFFCLPRAFVRLIKEKIDEKFTFDVAKKVNKFFEKCSEKLKDVVNIDKFIVCDVRKVAYTAKMFFEYFYQFVKSESSVLAKKHEQYIASNQRLNC